ncbi:hypothetical protein Pan153_31210 [Gimesia panareensis]|uniref:Uncharacterized protein n=1 Tax=Gimesia panareensis TaxID=2527978 RepID=A0A518FQ38_9PLAN|nr:hypothetical protein [Gimesia panareensis]QDV18463.1 hypothetical protein Pan153_31210 [Gimesia panareensis]
MDWFTFLILLLTASLTALAVWWAIQKWFRDEAESISEASFQDIHPVTDDSEPQHALYWNFTSVLIAVCALLLVLGISVQTTSIRNPVTWTLGAALILIWAMALWSGMLSSAKQSAVSSVPPPPELTIYQEQELSSTSDQNQTEET